MIEDANLRVLVLERMVRWRNRTLDGGCFDKRRLGRRLGCKPAIHGRSLLGCTMMDTTHSSQKKKMRAWKGGWHNKHRASHTVFVRRQPWQVWRPWGSMHACIHVCNELALE